MASLNSVTVYQFSDFDYSRFINYYLAEINEHYTQSYIYCDTPDSLLQGGLITVEQYPTVLKQHEQLLQNGIVLHHKKRGTVTEDIIKCKVQYLQDLVIRSSLRNKYGTFSLYSVLLKTIIGDEYSTMLSILCKMGYLLYGDGYNGVTVNKRLFFDIGYYSSIYSIPHGNHFESITIVNAKLKGYIEKEKICLAEYYSDVLYPDIDSRYGVGFSKAYINSLCKLRVENKQGLTNYIQRQIHKNSESMHYYNSLCLRLQEKNKIINKIDNAGRIYHVLTNADREIKQFLNIEFSADCKNSHPLLFNYILFKWRKISTDDAFLISSSMHLIQDTRNLRGSLQQYVANHVLDLLADDELEYIYLTTRGRLWDDISSKHPELNRNDIKKEMFSQVFYSKHKHIKSWQIYAKEFSVQFPNVMRLIQYWRQGDNAPDIKTYMQDNNITTKKTAAALSVSMMNLEAKIFSEILSRIYKKRWHAFHIHDCIVVPKTKNKNKPTKPMIIKIMKDVYKKYGLVPTFD